MKLPRIAGNESTVKVGFSFKESTANLLEKYQDFYQSVVGGEKPTLKDVVEAMLLHYMADDKAFQKFVRDSGAPVKERRAPVPSKDSPQAVAAPSSLAGQSSASAGSDLFAASGSDPDQS